MPLKTYILFQFLHRIPHHRSRISRNTSISKTFNSFTGFHWRFSIRLVPVILTFNSFTGFHSGSVVAGSDPGKRPLSIPSPDSTNSNEPEVAPAISLIFQFLHRIPLRELLDAFGPYPKDSFNSFTGFHAQKRAAEAARQHDFQFLHRIPQASDAVEGVGEGAKLSIPSPDSTSAWRSVQPRRLFGLSIPSPDSTVTVVLDYRSDKPAFNSFTGFHEKSVVDLVAAIEKLSIPSPDSTHVRDVPRARQKDLSIPSPDSTSE